MLCVLCGNKLLTARIAKDRQGRKNISNHHRRVREWGAGHGTGGLGPDARSHDPPGTSTLLAEMQACTSRTPLLIKFRLW